VNIPNLTPKDTEPAKQREFQVVNRSFSLAGLAEKSGAPEIVKLAAQALLGEDFKRERKFIAVHEVKRRVDGTIESFNPQAALDAQNLDDLIDLLVRMKDHAMRYGCVSLETVEKHLGPCDCGEDHGPRYNEGHMHTDQPKPDDDPKKEE
jgi:hypothetical protein